MSLAHFKRRKEPVVWLAATDGNTLSAERVAQVFELGIRRHGRHVELSNGIRGSDKDGRLIWCSADGLGIGDNVALAQHLTGFEFRPALAFLLRSNSCEPSLPVVPKVKSLRLPRGGEVDRQAGRAYLLERGITLDVLNKAEDCGMLWHIDGAVLFVGYDCRRILSATRRGYLPTDPTPKRDLTGSDKAFPAILQGRADIVWVVEGGVDALALHSILRDPPTTIVTGGSGCRSWIQMPHMSQILSAANNVVIACDREDSKEKQVRTDAQHRLQADQIAGFCRKVTFWYPPTSSKDIADMLLTVQPQTCFFPHSPEFQRRKSKGTSDSHE
ncbi:hypothetical protein [Propionivibrio sp.]|uniref:hypothetical protein n=1 Tax=Propionivibrio sp. TaxID=2212460 RepID=UPI003BF04D68